jgi:N-6 DNA Methylase
VVLDKPEFMFKFRHFIETAPNTFKDTTMTKTVFDFLQETGRLPQLGDDHPPWDYRGFLLPYIIGHHALGMCGNRWAYQFSILGSGKLPDEPIPQVTFEPPNNKIYSDLHEWSKLIGYDCGGWSDFISLLEWLCFALGVDDNYQRDFSPEVNEKLYRGVNLVPLLESPYDYLGSYVAMHKANGFNPTNFYPTPHQVVECMVRLTMHDLAGEDLRTKSVCDPCVGSGRMLLHAANYSLNLYGQDIDRIAIMMTKINGSLYAPWISFPIPKDILGVPEITEVFIEKKIRHQPLLPFMEETLLTCDQISGKRE